MDSLSQLQVHRQIQRLPHYPNRRNCIFDALSSKCEKCFQFKSKVQARFQFHARQVIRDLCACIIDCIIWRLASGPVVPLRQALVRSRQPSDSETQLNGRARFRRALAHHEPPPTNSTATVRDEVTATEAKDPPTASDTGANGTVNGRQVPRLIADWPPSMLIEQQKTAPINGRRNAR